jgi:1,4-alpha-glucan branching enzyme/maltooligosyltrehalose trehalohydrolase
VPDNPIPFAHTTTHAFGMPFGASFLPQGGVRFRLWAPQARRVELLVWEQDVFQAHAAEAQPRGWHEYRCPWAAEGTRYQWRLDGALCVPDPASRSNPDGPHAPSAVVDPRSFAWDAGWKGRPWSEAVIYEMHVGTFTQEGTYAAAADRLVELAALGITAIELMPLSAFPGAFGWGYDGVLPFAPYPGYGSPADLKRFIQAAHRLGLMVFLDVVYNHFGPDGNYLAAYAPQFISPVHRNPWGDSLNFDAEGSETVRSFFVHNALYWLEEYRFDGLRLDAVHAIVDDSVVDVVDELAYIVRQRINDRQVHLVLENEHNEFRRLPGTGRYDAQWNDDFHHALHVALTGERAGYYRDYGERPAAQVARSLAHGFLWENAPRIPGGGRQALVEAPAQPLGAMVNFLTNHDQTGNRAFGERLSDLMAPGARAAGTALTLLSPAIPMIFAGEEFAARTPFLYFADFDGELGEAVTQGRLREFGSFARRADGRSDALPPPCDARTFQRSKLDREAAASQPDATAMRALVARLLAARRAWFTPRAHRLRHGRHTAHMTGPHSFLVRWRYTDGEVIELSCNLGADAVPPPDRGSLPWQPLDGLQEFLRIGSLNSEGWAPWSAAWRFGTEPATPPDVAPRTDPVCLASP